MFNLFFPFVVLFLVIGFAFFILGIVMFILNFKKFYPNRYSYKAEQYSQNMTKWGLVALLGVVIQVATWFVSKMLANMG